MKIKKLYNISDIFNYLQQKKPYFKIYLIFQTTNYNISFESFYLNYSDLPQIANLLKKTFNPPFTIQINSDLEKKYDFDIENKILFLQKPFLSKNKDSLSILEEQLKNQVLKDL